MSTIRSIQVLVELGVPNQPTHKLSVEDRVRDMLELLESGHHSTREWATLCKLYRSLRSRVDTCTGDKKDRVVNLLRMIEPALGKYGYHSKYIEKD